MNKPISFVHTGTPIRDPLHYTACGLDNVYLTSGYELREIGGERYVSVHDAEDLHKEIAVTLVRHKKVLTGSEIRFLRKYLDLTQRELGAMIGVSDQSIARYEKEQTPLAGSEDSLLRLLVTTQADGCIDVRSVLESLRATDDAADADLTFARADDEWKVAA